MLWPRKRVSARSLSVAVASPLIASVDESVGRVMATLDELKLYHESYKIIFERKK